VLDPEIVSWEKGGGSSFQYWNWWIFQYLKGILQFERFSNWRGNPVSSAPMWELQFLTPIFYMSIVNINITNPTKYYSCISISKNSQCLVECTEVIFFTYPNDNQSAQQLWVPQKINNARCLSISVILCIMYVSCTLFKFLTVVGVLEKLYSKKLIGINFSVVILFFQQIQKSFEHSYTILYKHNNCNYKNWAAPVFKFAFHGHFTSNPVVVSLHQPPNPQSIFVPVASTT